MGSAAMLQDQVTRMYGVPTLPLQHRLHPCRTLSSGNLLSCSTLRIAPLSDRLSVTLHRDSSMVVL